MGGSRVERVERAVEQHQAVPEQQQRLVEMPQHEQVPATWHKRAITKINEYQDKILPHIPGVTAADAFAKRIDDQFKDIVEKLRGHLKKDFKHWLKDLAFFVATLPAVAAINVIEAIYNMIAFILSTAAHPAEAGFKIAKMLVNFANELTKPESYTKFGAGMLGAALGQAAVGNPWSVVGIGLGIALMAVGLTAEAVLAAYRAENGKKWAAAEAAFCNRIVELPVLLLTGFYMGLIFGGIQKAANENAIRKAEQERAAVSAEHSQARLKEIGEKFVKENNLTAGRIDTTSYPDRGMVVTRYSGDQLDKLLQVRPDITHGIDHVTSVNFAQSNTSSYYTVVQESWYVKETHRFALNPAEFVDTYSPQARALSQAVQTGSSLTHGGPVMAGLSQVPSQEQAYTIVSQDENAA